MYIPKIKLLSIFAGTVTILTLDLIFIAILAYMYNADFVSVLLSDFKTGNKTDYTNVDINKTAYAIVLTLEIYAPFLIGGFVTGWLAKTSILFNTIITALILYIPFIYLFGFKFIPITNFNSSLILAIIGAAIAFIIMKYSKNDSLSSSKSSSSDE